MDRCEKKRHVAQRTCIVCGRKMAKTHLFRLVVDLENKVCLDRRQLCGGRGAYVCKVPECLTRVKLSRLQKAFRQRLHEDKWSPILTMMEAFQRSSG